MVIQSDVTYRLFVDHFDGWCVRRSQGAQPLRIAQLGERELRIAWLDGKLLRVRRLYLLGRALNGRRRRHIVAVRHLRRQRRHSDAVDVVLLVERKIISVELIVAHRHVID